MVCIELIVFAVRRSDVVNDLFVLRAHHHHVVVFAEDGAARFEFLAFEVRQEAAAFQASWGGDACHVEEGGSEVD